MALRSPATGEQTHTVLNPAALLQDKRKSRHATSSFCGRGFLYGNG
ncbi:hypothetical protein SAMN05216244_3678 [Sediminibacillus halophilus]|uniref:Uncharacterized protein n=1 Tax=Sediminibacillus halophilus TaxID=482461 RepID=A0A1G9WZH0_9BACI|nr:hypothetical protein SAMN05216244_3678 [Sediminibacillus halophilus]